MSSADPHRITVAQVLALAAIWTAAICGLTIKPPPDVAQISLKAKVPACGSKDS